MILKLHGVALSNYFNMVKHALHEKGIAYEFVNTRPSQEPELLARSPMGKVPFVETPHGFLSETDAILDYLEEVYPHKPLLPHDPYARAKVRQLMKVQELYVETPVHELVGVIFGREITQAAKDAAQPAARKGLAALGRLVKLQPWLAGSEFTLADIVVYYSFTLSNRIAGLVYQWDMLQEVPGLADWYQRFSEREVSLLVKADMDAAQAKLAARQK
ncbi:MAG TPA: glutathione S-transferase family protein [Candidatus Acidoferrum sp.]|nr:glutathione S-transferase family protein [Candidatus Acidoferrum sp.]